MFQALAIIIITRTVENNVFHMLCLQIKCKLSLGIHTYILYIRYHKVFVELPSARHYFLEKDGHCDAGHPRPNSGGYASKRCSSLASSTDGGIVEDNAATTPHTPRPKRSPNAQSTPIPLLINLPTRYCYWPNLLHDTVLLVSTKNTVKCCKTSSFIFLFS